MDYFHKPVYELFNGPLLTTSQGISCIAFSLVAIFMGILSYVLPANIASHPVFYFGWGLFIWPVFLFVTFVKHSQPYFHSSFFATFLVSVYGAMPYLIPVIKQHAITY